MARFFNAITQQEMVCELEGLADQSKHAAPVLCLKVSGSPSGPQIYFIDYMHPLDAEAAELKQAAVSAWRLR